MKDVTIRYILEELVRGMMHIERNILEGFVADIVQRVLILHLAMKGEERYLFLQLGRMYKSCSKRRDTLHLMHDLNRRQ